MFQSTHPRRVRRLITEASKVDGLFQSTHPRRVRLTWIWQNIKMNGFNPRTHVGCDFVLARMAIPISAFQSTHPRRVRQMMSMAIMYSRQFQSTHPRRVRPSQQTDKEKARMFQSTHPRRVRQDDAKQQGQDDAVSIHAPT